MNITTIVIVLISILLSMTFHEAMHAFTGHWLGDDTAFMMGRLTLNPLKHIDLFTTILLPIALVIAGLPPFGAAKPVPFNPLRVKWGDFGAALVGLSGPLTNLFLAVVVGLIWQFVTPHTSNLVNQVVATFCLVNVSFFIFNMIPLPPLDGSRVLYALVPESVQIIMRQIEAGGLITIVIFMLVIFPLITSTIGTLTLRLTSLILGTPIL
jgi:Zn-dependent protease